MKSDTLRYSAALSQSESIVTICTFDLFSMNCHLVSAALTTSVCQNHHLYFVCPLQSQFILRPAERYLTI